MKNKKQIIAIILILTLCVACASVYFITSKEDTTTTVFDPEFEDIQDKTEVTMATGSIEIPGYTDIYITAGEISADVDFYNPESNSVYFQITLVLTETGEEIYASKLFSPGQHLYEIELNRAIEKGEYDMTIVYSTYSMDEDYTPKNGANVSCVLIAQ
ncbi:MAG: hypothetical protein R3Y27_01775 [Clostridia bacterium]